MITTGAKQTEIVSPNMLFGRQKVATTQRMVAVKRDEALSRAAVTG